MHFVAESKISKDSTWGSNYLSNYATLLQEPNGMLKLPFKEETMSITQTFIS